MTKDQKKAAIVVALREYQDNLAAVQESEIPGGFDQLVRNALVKTLGDKFERIFDQADAATSPQPAKQGAAARVRVAAAPPAKKVVKGKKK